jgi:hypothetical protein
MPDAAKLRKDEIERGLRFFCATATLPPTKRAESRAGEWKNPLAALLRMTAFENTQSPDKYTSTSC